MKWKKLLTVFAIAWLYVIGMMGQQRLVPDTYSSIQSAIDAATEGDTVLVAEGTYYENINYNGKAITVASHFIMDEDTSHISKTIIDGSQYTNELKASVVTIMDVPNSNAALKGLTIKGGSGTYISAFADYFGGGVLILGNGAIIENNIVENNKMERSSGAFPGNGAGLYEGSTLIVRYNKVSNNETISTGITSGGGVAVVVLGKNVIGKINDNIITDNIVTSSVDYKVMGGGLYIETEYSYGADIQVFNNTISGNELHCNTNVGGGIYVVYNDNSPFPPTNSQVKIYNNLIHDNYASDRGGGIGVWNMAYIEYMNSGYQTPVDPIIYNNTFYNNNAENGGSGIFNYFTEMTLFNNILWDNGSTEIFMYYTDYPDWWRDNHGVIHSWNNNIKNGIDGLLIGPNAKWYANDNINVDPMLNPETFELMDGSPCIGTGAHAVNVTDIWYAAPDFDFNDLPRPNSADNWVDIGAIESQFANPVDPTLIKVPEEIETIQAAIDAATEGDTVLVNEGTYYENINYKGKAITVASQFIIDGDTSHISKTIIDGSHSADPKSGSVVLFVSGEDTTSVLMGMTITGGSGTITFGEAGYTCGAGVLIYECGAKISNNIIEGNHLIKDTNDKFYYPDSLLFGAGICAGVYGDHNLIIEKNLIQNNTIQYNDFSCGAGMYLSGGTKGIVDIRENKFLSNSIKSDREAVGGAFGYHGLTQSIGDHQIIIHNNLIENNSVQSSYYAIGGGIFINEYKNPINLQIYNNIITNNTSNKYGGGIIIEWADVEIFNNTIYNNKAGIAGNSLYVRSYQNAPSTAYLFNNIMWSENGSVSEIIKDNNCYIYASYNDIEGGYAGEGNIDADPMLDTETFELLESSPCIGTGADSVQIESVWYKAPPYDFNDSIRPHPFDQFVDIGAIESPYDVATTIEDYKSNNSKISISPNPIKETAIIETSSENLIRRIELIDLSGKVIRTYGNVNSHKTEINCSQLNSGLYLLKIYAGKEYVRKVIVE